MADNRSRHDERETAVMELYHSGVLKHIGDALVMKLAETAQLYIVEEEKKIPSN